MKFRTKVLTLNMGKEKKYKVADESASILNEPATEYAVIAHAHSGIPIQYLNKLSDRYDISINDWAGFMGISTKSIQRYQQQDNILSATQTEFVFKIEQLYKIGKEVFGTTENFKQWLQKPAYGLGNKIPEQILNTISGINLVINQLQRIAFGALA